MSYYGSGNNDQSFGSGSDHGRGGHHDGGGRRGGGRFGDGGRHSFDSRGRGGFDHRGGGGRGGGDRGGGGRGFGGGGGRGGKFILVVIIKVCYRYMLRFVLSPTSDRENRRHERSSMYALLKTCITIA